MIVVPVEALGRSPDYPLRCMVLVVYRRLMSRSRLADESLRIRDMAERYVNVLDTSENMLETSLQIHSFLSNLAISLILPPFTPCFLGLHGYRLSLSYLLHH